MTADIISQTRKADFSSPDFELLANAYHLKYRRIEKPEDFEKISIWEEGPEMLEIRVPEKYCILPEHRMGESLEDLVPKIDRKLYKELKEYGE